MRGRAEITYFQGHEKGNRFHAEISSIHVVAHEEVVRVRHIATNSEELRCEVKEDWGDFGEAV